MCGNVCVCVCVRSSGSKRVSAGFFRALHIIVCAQKNMMWEPHPLGDVDKIPCMGHSGYSSTDSCWCWLNKSWNQCSRCGFQPFDVATRIAKNASLCSECWVQDYTAKYGCLPCRGDGCRQDRERRVHSMQNQAVRLAGVYGNVQTGMMGLLHNNPPPHQFWFPPNPQQAKPPPPQPQFPPQPKFPPQTQQEPLRMKAAPPAALPQFLPQPQFPPQTQQEPPPAALPAEPPLQKAPPQQAQPLVPGSIAVTDIMRAAMPAAPPHKMLRTKSTAHNRTDQIYNLLFQMHQQVHKLEAQTQQHAKQMHKCMLLRRPRVPCD